MKALVILLLTTVPVQAQIVRVSNTRTENCQNGFCRRVSDWGTGTIIADDGRNQWILTAAHCVRDAGSVAVGMSRSQMFAASVVAKQDTSRADMALLKTGRHFRGEPMAIAETLEPGSRVTSGGLAEFQPMYQTVSVRSMHILPMSVRHGDSGGPVIADGRLAGVVKGNIQNANKCWFTPLPVLWPWLHVHCPPCRAPQRYIRKANPPPQPADNRVAELERQIADLQSVVESLELRQGPQGRPGKDAGPFTLQFVSRSKRDPSKLFELGQVRVSGPGTYQVELPDVTVQWLNENKVIAEQSFAAGKPLKLDIQQVQPK